MKNVGFETPECFSPPENVGKDLDATVLPHADDIETSNAFGPRGGIPSPSSSNALRFVSSFPLRSIPLH